MTLQYKHNIHTLSWNIEFISVHLETGKKSLTEAHFLFLELVQINVIFGYNVCILSISEFKNNDK